MRWKTGKSQRAQASQRLALFYAAAAIGPARDYRKVI
jgi:hypothetical protein